MKFKYSFAMYYTHQELQFDHHLIVLWQLFQFLEWVLILGGGTIIRHTGIEDNLASIQKLTRFPTESEYIDI